MKKLISLVFIAVLAACAPTDQAPSASGSTGGATPGLAASATDVEARAAAIEDGLLPSFTIHGESENITPLVERMDELGVPGVSIAVIDGGEVAWARGWGLADIASGRPVTPETLFQAASISKPVAAVAALQLVDNGTIDLDADVNDYLTSWQVPDNAYTAGEKVTLRRLLTHTAGTTVWGFPGYGPDDEVPSTVGVLDGEGNTEAVRVFKEPGESWRYSGGGYTVMQLMLEDLGGRSFAELLREAVVEPVGMTRSSYEQPLPGPRRNDAATGYRPDGTPVDGNYHTYPEKAAAGLWTTPTDLARFAIAIQRSYSGVDETLLSQETARAMLTPSMNGQGLGPGINADGLRFGHGGANEGFRCQLTAFIEGDRGVVVMTNSDSGGRLANEIILTVADEYGWPVPRPDEKVVAALAEDDYQRVTGNYEVEGVPGGVLLRYTDGRLWLIVPGSPELELLPESATSFFVRLDGRPVAFEFEGDDVVIVAMGTRGRKVGR